MAAALPRRGRVDRRRAGAARRARRSGRTPCSSANHTSWLDILVLGGATGCAFVSKDELGHPLHPLARRPERDRLRQAQPRARAPRTRRSPSPRRSKATSRSPLFPEGTTGPGTHLLPFRSTLLEAANFAAKDVAIRPVAIDYGAAARRDRLVATSRARTMCCACSAARARLPVTVQLLAPLDRSGDRKQLAQRGARGDRAKRSASTSRAPLAYRRRQNDSQDFQNQKLRLPDERL